MKLEKLELFLFILSVFVILPNMFFALYMLSTSEGETAIQFGLLAFLNLLTATIFIAIILPNMRRRKRLGYPLFAFDSNQLDIIENAYKNGLNKEHISIFADTKFDTSQMYSIYDGFKEGLDTEQIQLYAISDFNDKQMNEIKLGFIYGLTLQQVKIYANPKYGNEQMAIIRKGLDKGFTDEEISQYAKLDLNIWQMSKIFNKIEKLHYEQKEMNRENFTC